MGKCKGAYMDLKEFIVSNFGEAGLNKVLAEADKPAAELLTQAKSYMWLNAEPLKNLYRICNRLFGDGTTGFYRRIGATNANRDLPRFFKVLISLGSPKQVFSLFGFMWKFYHDTGHPQILKHDKTSLKVEVVGYEDACEEFCNDIAGYLEVMLKMIKLKNPKVVHSRCSSQGHESCIFESSWDL